MQVLVGCVLLLAIAFSAFLHASAGTQVLVCLGLVLLVGSVTFAVKRAAAADARAEQEALAARARSAEARRARLVALYGEDVTEGILAQQIWQGMTRNQLIESRGMPDAIANEVSRRGATSIFKYRLGSSHGFRMRIWLVEDRVTRWKEV